MSNHFRIGLTIAPKLLLGFEFAGASVVRTYDLVATLFPWSEGFFMRGGFGLSSSGGEGTNVTVGTGYAFWLGRAFNLTVNLDYSAQFWGSAVDEETSRSRDFWALGFGFDWY
jgi:hypothetical protein